MKVEYEKGKMIVTHSTGHVDINKTITQIRSN